MQQITEHRGLNSFVDTLVGFESPELLQKFRQRALDAQTRLESGETDSLTIKTTRRIGRKDICPCGSGMKFGRCCGKRLAKNDERLVN